MRNRSISLAILLAICCLSFFASAAQAEGTIKLGLSVPLSGPAAAWGQGSVWMCNRAASEINAAGGVEVDGNKYEFKCVAYDNKYTAAGGTRVAQTLINRDGIKFIAGTIGTAPTQALQSLAEHKGDVLLVTTSWGKSLKGPKHLLTFTQINTPAELLPRLIGAIKEAHPQVETVALLDANDATGKQTSEAATKAWGSHGVKVVSSNFFERGTTQFRPIAAKLASLNPDAIALGATPPPTAGRIIKALSVLGWDGVKVLAAGTSAKGVMTTGGNAADGLYMGLAVDFTGSSATSQQREASQEYVDAIGVPLNAITIGFYDSVYAIKAGIEGAQSLDPEKIAKALPKVCFHSFYGSKASFGGKDMYGTPQQIQVPVIVTQIQNGKLVQVERVAPEQQTCGSAETDNS